MNTSLLNKHFEPKAVQQGLLNFPKCLMNTVEKSKTVKPKITMKNITFSICLCAAWLTATSQNSAYVDGNLQIHAGGTLAFFGDLEVATNGLLHNEAGTLTTHGEVSGEARIQLDANANLEVLGETFTFAHETNEVINDLVIGTAGLLEVPAGRSLTTNGTFNNQRTGQAGIRLLADATGYGQLLTLGTVNNKGLLYAEQYLTSANTPGWRHLASPVATTLAALDDDIETYYEAPGAGAGTQGNSAQWNLWWYDASPDLTLTGADNPATETSKANSRYYTPAQDNSEFFGPTTNAKAYITYTGGAFGILNPNSLIDVEGAFGNGDYSFDLWKTHDKGAGTYAKAGITPYSGAETNPLLITGWNLIPNPYPSNLDVSALFDAHNLGLEYKAVHIWDPTNRQYTALAHDALTTSMIQWNNNSGILVDNQNIAPFQSFWVKADLHEYAAGQFGGSSNHFDNQTIILTNDHRTVEATSHFFKKIPAHIALRLWNPNQTKRDQALVAFDAGFESGLENDDAIKMLSSDILMPELSTLVEGVPTSINRLALPAPGHAVPVRFQSKVDQEPFFLGIAEHDIDLSWTIHVFDWHTKRLHDLRAEGPYAFINDNSFEGDNRFTVYINYKEAGYDPLNNVRIWGGRNGIEVSFANPNNQEAKIEIMDAAGKRLFYSNAVATHQNFEWPIYSQEMRMYVVRVTTGKTHTIEKVVR